MKLNSRKIIALVACLVVSVALCTPAMAQDAGALYKSKCASCHAADGSGNTPVGTKMGVKSFAAPEVAKNSDAQWTEITKKGQGKMPGYDGKLTDDQIKDLVKFCRDLSKGK